MFCFFDLLILKLNIADQNKTKFNIGTFRSNPGNELEISISKKLNGFGLKLYKSMSTDTGNLEINPF